MCDGFVRMRFVLGTRSDGGCRLRPVIGRDCFGCRRSCGFARDHELGHTLGFRHEHTRPEAGVCFEDNNWRPLTPYDSDSIMHYPQCNGTSSDLGFSPLDAQGVAALTAPDSPRHLDSSAV